MNISSLYKTWTENTASVKDGYLSDKTFVLHNELISIKNDEAAINDRFYTELDFGTAGLRGVLGAGTNRMNIFTVGKVTLGIAKYLNNLNKDKKSIVAISYDSRNMSKEFAAATASVFNAAGIITYTFDTLQPTPILSFAVRYLKADAGVMITASHNPAKYNGYKVYGEDGSQVMPEPCKLITAQVNSINTFFETPSMPENEARQLGLYRDMPDDLLKTYYSLVETTIIDRGIINSNKEKIKIVYTPLFGCGNVPVCEILSRLGFNYTVVKEQQSPDGNFPGLKNPNPENKEAFDIAVEYGEKVGATLLVATDPDADRIGIMSKYNGQYYPLTGNQTGALLLDYILTMRKQNGTLHKNAVFVKTIVTSMLSDKIANAFDVETISVLTGFKFIADKIKLFDIQGRQFILGFEESYGYLTGTFVRDKDAVIATAIICEMAAYYASQNMTVYEALQKLYEKYGYSVEAVQSFEFEGQEGMATMSKIMDLFRTEKISTLAGGKVIHFNDYLKQIASNLVTEEKISIDLPKSNVLSFEMDNNTKVIIRPSGTEPKIKLYFFSTNMDRAVADSNMSLLKADAIALVDKFKQM